MTTDRLLPSEKPSTFEELLSEFEDLIADRTAVSLRASTVARQCRVNDLADAARSALTEAWREMEARYSVCPNCDTSWTNSEISGEWSRLRSRISELEARIEKYQNDEASVCPEDVGFVEYIRSLEADALTEAEIIFLQGCVKYPSNISDHAVYNTARDKLIALRRSISSKPNEND